ncbi:MAG: hypothetical protein RL672_741 [Actinomycetota bacterium]
MDIGLILLLVAVVLVPLALGIPASRRNRKTAKKGRAAMGAGLGVMDEIFHPNAKAARFIIEQKREEIAPMPSPEDKPTPEDKPNPNQDDDQPPLQ